MTTAEIATSFRNASPSAKPELLAMTILLRGLLAALVIVLASILDVHAQNTPLNDGWRWVHFGMEAGLPSASVTSILAGSDSTMWVGTEAGLAWFDGYKWNSIDSAHGAPQHSLTLLSATSASSIVAISQRKLYQGGKLGFRELLDDVDEAVEFDPLSLLVRANSTIYLCRYGQRVPMKSDIQVDSGSVERALYYVEGSGVWVNANDGLYRWQNVRFYEKYPTNDRHYVFGDICRLTASTLILSIAEPGDRAGVWELTADGDLNLRYTGGRDCNLSSRMIGNDIYCAIFNAGQIIMLKNGIEILRTKLPTEGVIEHSVFMGPDGNLWVSTNAGVYCYRYSSTRWTVLDERPVGRTNTMEIVHSASGQLWVGTDHGIDIYEADSIVKTISQINGNQIRIVTGLIEDDSGHIWISSGSAFTGTYRWDGKTWTHIQPDSSAGGVYFHKIRKDNTGRLWFLGLGNYYENGSQPGAFVYAHGKFTHFSTGGSAREGLSSGRVYAFAESPDSTLWFGTSRGLDRYRSGTWTHWIAGEDFKLKNVFALAVDHQENLWFADRGTAVGRLDPSGRMTFFTEADGIPHQNTWDLRVDSLGAVWITTDKGPAAYRDGKWTSYGAETGLLDYPLWPILPMGSEVYIGTRGAGVVRLNPNECVQPPPQIAIERPVIESDEAFLRWHPSSYFAEPGPERVPTRYRVNRGEWSNWDYTHEVVLHNLTAGSYFFQIQARNLFGVVDDAGQLGTFVVAPPFYLRAAFFAPIAVLVLALGLTGFIYVLAVRRKGRELAKSEAKFRRLTESTFDGIVIYAHGNVLEANDSAARMFGYEPQDFVGKPISSLLSSYERQPESKRSEDFVQHPLEARGYRRDGQVFWIEIVENDIPFNGSSGGTARIAAIRNITERKEAEEQFAHYQEELKALVLELSNIEEHERKKLATYLHDYLSQALGFCRMKLGTMHGAINEADVRQIKEYVEDMFEKTQTLTFELSPPILYELGLGAALSSLAERMQSEHGIAFECEFEETPVDLAENLSLLMFYSVRELCINVVKHAQATKVTIGLELTENYLHARVADNGIGFIAAASAVPQRTRGGFGLFNIHERLSHLGGRLDIRPRPGGGTAVSISLPLEQDEPAHTTPPIL